jgi:hypothetical protein
MPRLMSVALTADAVVERRKTVTRRLGWRHAKRGMHLTLCRKVMGRKRRDGTVEPLVRLAEVEVVSVRRQQLCEIPLSDVAAEGFPEMTRAEFIEMFCREMHCSRYALVTRIEWRYLEGS